jgi:hypothetical protein
MLPVGCDAACPEEGANSRLVSFLPSEQLLAAYQIIFSPN